MSEPKSPDPLAEGEQAASSTGPTVSNPYPPGTEEHAKWLKGYESGVEADIEEDGPASDFA